MALSTSLATSVQTAPADEPAIQSYAIDYEAKLLTDRRTNGLSDTFPAPWGRVHRERRARVRFDQFLQLGSVARANFPKLWTAVAAAGYRWGSPQGWHYGLGLAPRDVSSAPR